MIEAQADLPFSATMARLNQTYNLGIGARYVRMAHAGELTMALTAKDLSHRFPHLHAWADTTTILLEKCPALTYMVDWGVFTAGGGFHDVPKATLRQSGVNILIGTVLEPAYAARPAGDYMRRHRFSEDEKRRITGAIMMHPYPPDHPTRRRWEGHMDAKTAMAARLMNVVDTIDLFRLTRQAPIYEQWALIVGKHLSNFLYPIYPFLFERMTRFSMDMGNGCQQISEFARQRREVAVGYLRQGVPQTKPIPNVVSYK